MSHDDAEIRQRPRNFHDIEQLRVKNPGVECEPERGDLPQTLAYFRLSQDVRAKAGMTVADDRTRIPSAGITYTFEAAAAGANMRLEHGLDAVTERQVCIADNSLRNASRPVIAAVTHGRDAGSELCFSHRPHFHGPCFAPHCIAFQEYGGHDVVARLKIRGDFVDQITVVRVIPQVLMC